MIDKLDYYDVLSILVPGALGGYWLAICFPQTTAAVGNVRLPESIDVIAYIALSVFIGHLIQALSSLVEPFLEWTWGGRPSDRALQNGIGDRYLPADAAHRIREKLALIVGRGASDRSLFLWAMRRSQTSPYSRVQLFNSLYAYHRALLILVGIGVALWLASARWGAADAWSESVRITVLVILLALLVLVWGRTKQRAFHYVREVLLVTEQMIDDGVTDSTSASSID